MRSQNTKQKKQSRQAQSLALSTLGVAAFTLMGTGSFVFAAEDLNHSTVLPEVVVTGNTKKTYNQAVDLSLPKYMRPLLDTPQSVSVVSRQLLDDQHATTMREAVRNVAGISIAAGEGGAQGDNLTLRGFSARNDIFLDGMRDFGSYYRDTFNWDSVEVLKGPSSVAFGRGSTGGVVNQVSKYPESKRFSELDLTVGGRDKRRASLDINQPLSEHAAFRVAAFTDQSGVMNRDVVQTNHYGVAPSVSLGMGTGTRLTLSYLHEESDDIPDYGIPWLFNSAAPVNRETFYGFRSDYLKTKADVGTVKLEYDINQDVTIRDQFRVGNYSRKMRATEPKLAGSPTLSTPLDSIVINRNEINTDSSETFLQNQVDVTAKFKTGALDHSVVSGVEVGRETSSPIRYTITGVPTTNLLSPNTNQTYAGTNTSPTVTKVVSETLSGYVMDTVKFNDQWEAMGGTRWDQFQTVYTQNTTYLSSVDRMWSWRGAIVYKPLPEGSIYVDYGNSFNPSSEALSLSSGTVNLAPEQNATYELGTKWELADRKLSVRAALFRTDKQNARETDPLNSANITLAGNQRVDGVELETTGRLTDQWQVSAGYAYMKSQVLASSFYPDSVGQPLANVPEHTFNVWSTYQVSKQVEVGGGANYVGARRGSSTASLDPTTGLPREVAGYWLFNAMAVIHVAPTVDVQFNLNNVFNVSYIDQVHNAHLIPGEGRSFLVSAKVKF